MKFEATYVLNGETPTYTVKIDKQVYIMDVEQIGRFESLLNSIQYDAYVETFGEPTGGK